MRPRKLLGKRELLNRLFNVSFQAIYHFILTSEIPCVDRGLTDHCPINADVFGFWVDVLLCISLGAIGRDPRGSNLVEKSVTYFLNAPIQSESKNPPPAVF